jgi:imidazolonepropionase-like amidohydrolase
MPAWYHSRNRRGEQVVDRRPSLILHQLAPAALLSLFACNAVSQARAPTAHNKASSAVQRGAPTPKIPLPFAQDPYPSTYRPLPRTNTLIVHATILDGVGGKFVEASVLMRAGKIVAVGSGVQAPAGFTVIDAQGRWVTPGIIDIHSHDGTYVAPLTSVDAVASDVSEGTDPNTANVWVEHSVNPQDPAFVKALEGGVTTLQVLPGSSNLFGGRSVILKTVTATTMQGMKFPGAPAGLKMACGESPKGHYGGKGVFPSSRMGEVAGVRDAFIRARDYQHKWEAYENGSAAEPPTRDLKLDTLAAVLRGEVLVHMHCYRADEMAVMLDVAQEFGFHITAFHHAAEAYKIADLLAQRGVCAAVWSDWWGFKMEAYDAIRENAAFVDAAGACVTMHSDSPWVGQRLTLEAAKAAAAGRQAGVDVPPERAIRWVTSNPAKAIGLDSIVGSIAPGKNADLVLWSGDPFSVYTKADEVFIDGALVFDRADPRRQPRADFELGQPTMGARP